MLGELGGVYMNKPQYVASGGADNIKREQKYYYSLPKPRLQSMAVFDEISGVQDKISGVQVCRLILVDKYIGNIFPRQANSFEYVDVCVVWEQLWTVCHRAL